MIKADDLRKVSDKALGDIPMPEVEKALHNIEQNVMIQASLGRVSFTANCAIMVDDPYGYPTDALRRAVAKKLSDLGYSYEEKSMLNGQYWFTVSW